MKLVIVILAVATGMSALALFPAPRRNDQVKNILNEAYSNLVILDKWLPFSEMGKPQSTKLRKDYDKLQAELKEIMLLENPAEQKKRLEPAVQSLRKVAMQLPIHQIDSEEIEDKLNRLVLAEDLLLAAVVGLDVMVPTSSKVWTIAEKNLKVIWVGKMTVNAAKLRCPDEFPAAEKGHLITAEADELQGIWRDMTDASKNKAFAEAASEFTRVWTSTQDQKGPQPDAKDPYFYFDIKEKVQGTAEGTEMYEALCAAKINPVRR